MQCCCCLQTEANHPWLPDTGQRRQSLDNARYAEMMRKNIKIPPNYYMSTDPRTLPAEVIKQFASSTGELGPRRLVARSSSSVTVRRAQCVRLRTNRVKRATSFSENILAQYRQYSVANNIINNNNNNDNEIKVNQNYENLPWEYRKAGIGVCLKGKTVSRLRFEKTDLICCPSPSPSPSS